MRFSSVAVLALVPAATLAAPLPHHEDRRQLGEFLGNIGDRLRGVAGTVVDSFRNPELFVARLQVVRGLRETGDALEAVGEEAQASGNAGVAALLADATAGLDAARGGVNNIGQALLSAEKPDAADQKVVAEGIKAAQDALALMEGAITNPDAALSEEIASAIEAAQGLADGGKGVLEASGLNFADLGLPDNFDTLPPAGAAPPPAAAPPANGADDVANGADGAAGAGNGNADAALARIQRQRIQNGNRNDKRAALSRL